MQLVIAFIIFLYMIASMGYFTYMFFQKKYLYYSAYFFMGLGFLVHTFLLSYYGVKCSTFPVNNLHEILSFMAWSTSFIFFLVQHKYPLRVLGLFAAPICTLTMIGSCIMSRTSLYDPKLFQSVWLGTHVLTTFLGYAGFTLAFGSGILYLLQENTIKKKKRGFFFNRLPSLELLDSTGYTCLVIGFSFLTIGLVTGSVYANSVWGNFWSWDPKEIWSLIVWVFYALLLHERLTVGWRGRRSAIMSIIGFGVLLFTFLGVNFLLKGHHEPFTSI